MQHVWIQWIFCSIAQSVPIECSGFHAASLNAEYSIHFGAMDYVCMQWSPGNEAQCIPIECSGFYAAWPKVSRFNAVDSMQRDWMQWIPCSMKKWNPIQCRVFYAAWLNAVDSCSMIECSGFFAAWPKASRLNAVDSMQRHGIQKTPCIVVQWIPIVFSGDHAVRTNASWVNALDLMQHGPKHPDWMQRIPCSMIECSGFYAAWPKHPD